MNEQTLQKLGGLQFHLRWDEKQRKEAEQWNENISENFQSSNIKEEFDAFMLSERRLKRRVRGEKSEHTRHKGDIKEEGKLLRGVDQNS